MAIETVTVTIGKDGQIQAHVKGIAGVKCKDITDALSADLGKTLSAQPTADYYKQATATQRLGR